MRSPSYADRIGRSKRVNRVSKERKALGGGGLVELGHREPRAVCFEMLVLTHAIWVLVLFVLFGSGFEPMIDVR